MTPRTRLYGGGGPLDHPPYKSRPTRYYHGTSAKLEPGVLLVPGEAVGAANFVRNQHVYICEEQDAEPIWADNLASNFVESGSGLAGAAEYGAMGSDADGDGGLSVYEEFGEGYWHGFYVYLVEPIGEIEIDTEGEFEFDRRCASARVVRMVIDFEGNTVQEKKVNGVWL